MWRENGHEKAVIKAESCEEDNAEEDMAKDGALVFEIGEAKACGVGAELVTSDGNSSGQTATDAVQDPLLAEASFLHAAVRGFSQKLA